MYKYIKSSKAVLSLKLFSENNFIKGSVVSKYTDNEILRNLKKSRKRNHSILLPRCKLAQKLYFRKMKSLISKYTYIQYF